MQLSISTSSFIMHCQCSLLGFSFLDIFCIHLSDSLCGCRDSWHSLRLKKCYPWAVRCCCRYRVGFTQQGLVGWNGRRLSYANLILFQWRRRLSHSRRFLRHIVSTNNCRDICTRCHWTRTILPKYLTWRNGWACNSRCWKIGSEISEIVLIKNVFII